LVGPPFHGTRSGAINGIKFTIGHILIIRRVEGGTAWHVQVDGGERKYFVSYDDDTEKKKFKGFVHNINCMPTAYQRQRKELCSQSSVVKAYFVAANKKHAAKHPGTNTQPRFEII
jgi:hypothetical protein